MQKEQVKELLRTAADCASAVPENMQAMAFQEAVRLLVEDGPIQDRGPKTSKARTRRKEGKDKRDDQSDVVGTIMQKLTIQAFPDIEVCKTALDRSLYVLMVVRKESGIKSLTPRQIQEVLKGKLRINVKVEAIQMALKDAGKTVDRVPRGRSFAYEIMKDGEKHIDLAIKKADKRVDGA